VKVWAQWCGGPGYSAPQREDLESFVSLRDARETLEYRADFDPYYPCVEDSRMLIYLAEPNPHDPDWIPDRIITLGPRGGVREERL
jgi:hypothetical protein